jgi:hypothetical protein
MRISDLIKKIEDFILPSKPIIRFTSTNGAHHVSYPVLPAKQTKAEWFTEQVKKKSVKFAKCPGMMDYYQTGFVIRAWADIHIRATKHSVSVIIENSPADLQPVEMDFAVVDGIANIDGVAKRIIKLHAPWSIFAKEGYSAHVLPALFHSPFADKLHVYPGTVDYDKFHVCNFIFSPLQECEFTIWAGTPLLHVIPFKREHITSTCTGSSQDDLDKRYFSFRSRKPGLYRQEFQSKKTINMKVEK